MKTGKRTTIIIAAMLALVLTATVLAGCGGTSEGEITGAVTVTDQIGRSVTISATPERIISLAPSNTEILYALGLGDRVIARTDYDTYPPEALEKPSIGGFSTPNIEQIVAMGPDLVVAADIHKDQIVPQLEADGITVVCLAPTSLQEVMDAIMLVGKVTGVEKTAGDLVKSMEERIAAVTDKVKDLEPAQRPRTMYIVWPDPIMVGGGTTIQGELIVKAGGTNIAQDLEGYASVQLEDILAANPQVMIASTGMGEGAEAGYQFLLTDERLAGTDARSNGQVYAVDQDIISRGGPRIVDALEAFAAAIHPELFDPTIYNIQ
jgi:iron complex transport system substrate-binding protein